MKATIQHFQIWVNGDLWVDADLTKTQIKALSKRYLEELKGQLVSFKVLK